VAPSWQTLTKSHIKWPQRCHRTPPPSFPIYIEDKEGWGRRSDTLITRSTVVLPLRKHHSTCAGKTASFPARHFIHSTLWLAVVWLIRNFYFSIWPQLFLFVFSVFFPLLVGFHVLSTFFRFVCFVWLFLNFPPFSPVCLLSFGSFMITVLLCGHCAVLQSTNQFSPSPFQLFNNCLLSSLILGLSSSLICICPPANGKTADENPNRILP